MKPLLIFIYVSVVFLLTACKGMEKLGTSLGSGVDKKTKSIGKNLVAGAQESLTDSLFRTKLLTLIDSLATKTGSSTNRELMAIRDSLLSDKWDVFTKNLMENLSGGRTRMNLANLREALIGDTTTAKAKALIKQLIDQVLNAEINQRIGLLREELIGAKTGASLEALRDSLLGPATNMAIKNIVDTAMTTIAYRMNHDIKDALGNNVSFIQKYAIWLLVALGVIAAIIIVLVWRNRQKYLQMVSVLTTQIQNVDDERTYDRLTLAIKNAALQKGVEKDLNNYLKENNIHGKQEWVKRKNKMEG